MDPLDRFDEYAGRVHARLEKAPSWSHDQNFDRPAPVNIAEAIEELEDAMAWNFLTWTRLERLRAHLESSLQQQCNSDDCAATPEPPEPPVFRMVGAERAG